MTHTETCALVIFAVALIAVGYAWWVDRFVRRHGHIPAAPTYHDDRTWRAFHNAMNKPTTKAKEPVE